MGGSNALGTWGYLEAAHEMDGQLREAGITDVALVRCRASDLHGLGEGLYERQTDERLPA